MSPRAASRLETLGFSRVFDYVAGKADWLSYGLPTQGEEAGKTSFVQAWLERDVPTCRLRDRLEAVKEKARQSATGLCPVTNQEGVVLGLCDFESPPDDPTLTAEDVMSSGPTTLRPNYPADQAADRLRKSGKRGFLVTSSDGKLIGVFSGLRSS